MLNCVNKKISELKGEGKEEDRDSGLKIGEESANGSDYEYEYSDEEYEDYYEDEESDLNNNNPNVIVDLQGPPPASDVIEEYSAENDDDSNEEIQQDPISDMEENKDIISVGQSSGVSSLTGDSNECCDNSNENITTSNPSHFENIENNNESNSPTSNQASNSTVNTIVYSDENDVHPSAMENSNDGIIDNHSDYCHATDNYSNENQEIVMDEENNDSIEPYLENQNESCEEIINESLYSLTDSNFNYMETFDEEVLIPYEISDDEIQEENVSVIEETKCIVNTPPKTVFNKEEYIQLKTEELDAILKSAGFVKSSSMIEKVDEGDQCLLNLLDQMKREDQDFKVWERDDFSFLRWYVTRQMETLHGKVENLKFVESIQGDFAEYVNKMSQDGVPIDRTFIQAAATIFNKDIILIPVDGDTDYDVVVGGLNSGKSKGQPLYLGHIKQTENCPDIFVSVMPERIDKEKVTNILAGDLRIVDSTITVTNEEDKVDSNNSQTDSPSSFPLQNQWTRMDSFTGSSSKVDVLINDIIKGDNLDELFKKADYSDDDTDDSSISECDTIETIHEQDLPTPEADDYDLIDNKTTDEDICMNEETDNNTTSHTEEGINAEVQCAEIHCVDNKYIFDENDDEDEDDGWIYDEETGYWIQQDVNANDGDETLENNDSSHINLQVTKATSSSEVNEDNTEREDYVENKVEVDNTHGNILEGQCDNKSEADEELNNCAEPFNDKDEVVGEESIKSAECCTLSNDNLKADIDNEIHEEDEVFVSDNIVSQDAINEVPEKMEDLKQATNNSSKSNSNTINDQQEESCQESIKTDANPKLVHRKLKISVSVTSNDQVNCENNIQSDPVSLDESEYIFIFYIYIVFIQSIIFYTLCYLV